MGDQNILFEALKYIGGAVVGGLVTAVKARRRKAAEASRDAYNHVDEVVNASIEFFSTTFDPTDTDSLNARSQAKGKITWSIYDLRRRLRAVTARCRRFSIRCPTKNVDLIDEGRALKDSITGDWFDSHSTALRADDQKLRDIHACGAKLRNSLDTVESSC